MIGSAKPEKHTKETPVTKFDDDVAAEIVSEYETALANHNGNITMARRVTALVFDISVRAVQSCIDGKNVKIATLIPDNS